METEHRSSSTDSGGQMRREWLSIDELTLDPVQSRDNGWTGDRADRKLASSVKKMGLLQDILVRPIEAVDLDMSGVDASYVITAGSRRYQAALQAGMEEVPCKILEADDIEAAWTSLTENTDREDLSEQERANQLRLIYDLIRPLEEPEECPECGTSVDGEAGLSSHWGHSSCEPTPAESRDITQGVTTTRFDSDLQARRYIAWRYLGRTDKTAVSTVSGHLQTADLPPLLQSLFKDPDERSEHEKGTLENFGIDAADTLGSGEGLSKASQVLTSVYNTVSEQFDTDAVNPTNAVLETVGQLRSSGQSEKQFEKAVRRFRRDLASEAEQLDATDSQQARFREVLEAHRDDLREVEGEITRVRPFKRVNVLSPDTEQYSRWYARVQAERDATNHGDLIRDLYQERLEALADERGWK